MGCHLLCAQERQASEFQVEAAFLYHFTTFVTWPSEAASDGPLVVGILGDPRDSFFKNMSAQIKRAIAGKTVGGHPLELREFTAKGLADLKESQILFLCPSEANRLKEILHSLDNAPVLTVSKMDNFTDSGGIINFVLRNNQVRLEINNTAARRSNLKISAKLLSLASRRD